MDIVKSNIFVPEKCSAVRNCQKWAKGAILGKRVIEQSTRRRHGLSPNAGGTRSTAASRYPAKFPATSAICAINCIPRTVEKVIRRAMR